LLTSVCTVCALALPSSALASGGSPVHVDPASPVAKEYALPLASARGAPPESGKPGKLFGSGIKHSRAAPVHTTTASTPAPTTASTPAPPPPSTQPQTTPVQTVTAPTTTPTAAPTPAPRPHAHRQPPHVTTVTLPVLTTLVTAKPLAATATPAAYRVLKPGSGSGLLWMVLAAVLVLALGSAGGMVLSRRR
jgi:pyruvate/2-oxoglutarate dehydrogenase complex dihydrolipoamide acyltransferase (E2) component